MKLKWLRSILVLLALVSALCASTILVSAAPQGTNGDELQVMQAEKLEIQLGVEWAGVEFQLKTDAGLYPGTVTVGTDGVLRLEIGGSSKYILTCLNSDTPAPEPDENTSGSTQAPATTESQSEGNAASDTEAGTVADIPIAHLVVFIGGMVLAVGTLITLHVLKKRREVEDGYDDDDDE